jgi:hypothetical protein
MPNKSTNSKAICLAATLGKMPAPKVGNKLSQKLATTLLLASLGSTHLYLNGSCQPCWAIPKGKPATVEGKMITKSVIVTGEKAAAQSYGENIDQANLIVSAEYQENGSILIKQVLKGDKSWSGKTIKLASAIKMGCRQQPVPSIKNAAVLLRDNGKKEFSVVEIYDTPDQIAFLHCFIPIYANNSATTEKTKFTLLSKLFTNPKSNATAFEADPTATFKKEFLSALGTMKQPANFDLVKELYLRPDLSAKDKLSLQEWMANTGDKRVLPILYIALKSKDKFVSSDAISRLTYNYSSPATDKAIAEAYNSLPDQSKPMAARYLVKRGANNLVKPPLVASAAAAATPFQKASELEHQGKVKEAQALYLSILESPEDNNYVIETAMAKVLNAAKTQDASAIKQRVIKARLNWLNKYAKNSNYLEAQSAADILGKLDDARGLDALLSILAKRESIFTKANQTATFAIAELGASAKQSTTTILLREIESNTALAQKPDEQIILLLELAWLQQPDGSKQVSKAIEKNSAWLGSYNQVQPLLNGLPNKDEGQFLTQKLVEKKLPAQALDWIILRLGDLHESRAIDALMAEFEKPYSYSPETTKVALEKISNNGQAREVLVKKLKSIALNSQSAAQANAIELLAAIDGEKALPVVRQIINNGQLEAKVRALNIISRLGTKQDLALLLPMSNYWSGDRKTHYWVMQAIGELNNK